MKKREKVTQFVFENKAFCIGILIVMVLVFLSLFPGAVTGYDPDQINAKLMLKEPSAAHWFGTDNYGRDLYTRVIYSTRVDLLIGVGAMLVPFLLGTILGLISGYYGGKLDSFIMRIVDFHVVSLYGSGNCNCSDYEGRNQCIIYFHVAGRMEGIHKTGKK